MMKTIEGYTYKVNEHIGKGYSSTVHKGLNDRNGQEVSIKVIEMSKLQDPINQMLLQMEVTILRDLNGSKHVLQLYDVYATRNNTYLITELCQGDLSAMIKTRNDISYFEAVEILRQLVFGYWDIHQKGYLHRDIKPANIFYKNGIYKFGDFGFAIPLADIDRHKDYNVGSPVYMPPQALKQNIYSVSCDTWAIGIIFYQLIKKGTVPWKEVTEHNLYNKIMNQPIDNLTVGLPDVARKFLSLVLNLNPRLRLSPEKLLEWPNQLQAVSLDIRGVYPIEPKERNKKILRELNTNALNTQQQHISTVYFNHLVSPTNQNRTITSFANQAKDQQVHLKQIRKEPKEHLQDEFAKENTNQKIYEDTQFKQAYFFANNFINLVKFYHRVAKFIGSPTPLDLSKLEEAVVMQMFAELANLKGLMQNQQNCDCKIDNWNNFLKSSKGEQITKKLKKYQNKYRMFYKQSLGEKLNIQMISDGIARLLKYLEKQFNSKMVIGADYLATLYQLLHLRSKYSIRQFMRISKIDLIMQGNPYNANQEHLQKLKKKWALITG